MLPTRFTGSKDIQLASIDCDRQRVHSITLKDRSALIQSKCFLWALLSEGRVKYILWVFETFQPACQVNMSDVYGDNLLNIETDEHHPLRCGDTSSGPNDDLLPNSAAAAAQLTYECVCKLNVYHIKHSESQRDAESCSTGTLLTQPPTLALPRGSDTTTF